MGINYDEIWEINEGLAIPTMTGMEMIGALSNDYYCVYYIDFDKDIITPYRVAKAILADYRDLLVSETNYTKVLTTYANTTVVPADREMFLRNICKENMIKQLKEASTVHFDFRAVIDGQVMFCRAKTVDISVNEDEHIAVMGFSNVSRDVTKDIERYAFIDEKTGGDNYHMFSQNMDDAKKDGYIISVDIRSFKIINALCGVSTGDEVIRRMWRKIVEQIDGDEVAGHINGDRFVVFMPTDDEEEVIVKLNNISDAIFSISEDINVPKLETYYGVARWKKGSSVEEAVTRANEAQHQIRDEKDVNYAFYTQDDFNRLMDEAEMEQSFAEAIATEEFEIWYQPKFSPSGQKLLGAEALVRWRKPDGKVWPPNKFIPLFERDGLISKLDEYVFEHVCKDQKKWMNQGIEIIPISVNLSRASLYYDGVVARYVQIAKDCDIEHKWIPIEITESAAADSEFIHDIIEEFSEAGFFLHMDDFGSGYSALSMLNKYNFDTLKLDKSLIDYIGNYSGDRLLMHTISLAKDLGMQVVAEGVEEKSQVGFLQKTKCDSVQGYIYSKPLEHDGFTEILVALEHGSIENKRDQARQLSAVKGDLSRIINNGREVLEVKCQELGVTTDFDISIEENDVYLNEEIFYEGALGIIDVVRAGMGDNCSLCVEVNENRDLAHGIASLFVRWTGRGLDFPEGFDVSQFNENVHIKALLDHLNGSAADFKVKYSNGELVSALSVILKLVMTE